MYCWFHVVFFTNIFFCVYPSVKEFVLDSRFPRVFAFSILCTLYTGCPDVYNASTWSWGRRGPYFFWYVGRSLVVFLMFPSSFTGLFMPILLFEALPTWLDHRLYFGGYFLGLPKAVGNWRCKFFVHTLMGLEFSLTYVIHRDEVTATTKDILT